MFYATGNGADLYHPRTVRATMGSIFRLPVRFGDAARVARSLSEDGILRLGTVRRGGIDYDRFDLGQPLALFFGSEGAGLSEPLRQGLGAQLAGHDGISELHAGYGQIVDDQRTRQLQQCAGFAGVVGAGGVCPGGVVHKAGDDGTAGRCCQDNFSGSRPIAQLLRPGGFV